MVVKQITMAGEIDLQQQHSSSSCPCSCHIQLQHLMSSPPPPLPLQAPPIGESNGTNERDRALFQNIPPLVSADNKAAQESFGRTSFSEQFVDDEDDGDDDDGIQQEHEIAEQIEKGTTAYVVSQTKKLRNGDHCPTTLPSKLKFSKDYQIFAHKELAKLNESLVGELGLFNSQIMFSNNF